MYLCTIFTKQSGRVLCITLCRQHYPVCAAFPLGPLQLGSGHSPASRSLSPSWPKPRALQVEAEHAMLQCQALFFAVVAVLILSTV